LRSKLSLQSWLGTSLRDARRQRGLTQAQLAQQSGITCPTLRNLERDSGTLASLLPVLEQLEARIVGRTLPPAATLGKSIGALRRRHGIGQRELATRCSVTQPTIVALERSTGRVSTLLAALEILGATPSIIGQGEAQNFFTSTAAASVNHAWTTPPHILATLTAIFGIFDLDPCASGRAARHPFARFHLSEEDNGLLCQWRGSVFLNPPYGRSLTHWLAKAAAEAKHGKNLVVALIPARTDTRWWHDHVANQADILLLRGRLKFGDGAAPAPFPSAIVFWNCPADVAADLPALFAGAWLIAKPR
jgi:phage N-6-adenine-methyltransferase